MEEDEHATRKMEKIKLEDSVTNGVHAGMDVDASKPMPDAGDGESKSPMSVDEAQSRSEGVNTPGSTNKPPRSTRKAPRKPAAREAPLFSDLPDVTGESCQSFQAIPDCLYGSKHLGSTDNDAFDCDCREEWRTLPPP